MRRILPLSLNWACRLIVVVLLSGSLATNAPPASAQAPTPVSGQRVAPLGQATINFGALAAAQSAQPQSTPPAGGVDIPFHTQVEPGGQAPQAGPEHTAAPATAPNPSFAPSQNYIGLDDIAGRSSLFFIPPDTMGAVGLTRNFVTLNNDYRVQTKATGATVSTVTMEAFWSSAGGTAMFDPVTLYDPINDRFIVVAASNAESTGSSIEVGVSLSNDPNGSYYLLRYAACSVAYPCGGGVTDWWADYPSVGFNKNWVAISVNMFPTAGGPATESRMLVVDYPLLRASTPTATYFTGLIDFTIRPCVTYSSSENTLYAPANFSSAAAQYRFDTITGSAVSPNFTQGTTKAHTLAPLSSGWANPAIGPDAPQAQGTGGAGDVAPIDVGDARIIRCSFRNNHIWYTQTIGLPKSGPTHTAAQWVELNTSGNDVDGGRVEDPTATSTNGGKWYAFPSLSVNMFEDAVMGFTQFSSAQFPAAAYSMRLHSDAAGTMRDPYIVKAGEGMYWTTFDCSNSSARNRWGDYSATQVDPSDDTSIWTLQEYSLPEGFINSTGCNSGKWSTWWAKVSIRDLFLPLIRR